MAGALGMASVRDGADHRVLSVWNERWIKGVFEEELSIARERQRALRLA